MDLPLILLMLLPLLLPMLKQTQVIICILGHSWLALTIILKLIILILVIVF